MGTRRAAIIGCLLLESLLSVPAFFALIPSATNGNTEASPETVIQNGKAAEIARVTRGDIKKMLLLDGELRAVSSRTIFSATSEEVKITYLPPEGTLVKAGERVVELDNSTILSKIKDIDERIIAAENDIVRTRSQHEAALRDMEVVLSTLWLVYEQSKLDVKVPAGVVPRRKFQESQLAFDKGKTEYENQLTKNQQKKK